MKNKERLVVNEKATHPPDAEVTNSRVGTKYKVVLVATCVALLVLMTDISSNIYNKLNSLAGIELHTVVTIPSDINDSELPEIRTNRILTAIEFLETACAINKTENIDITCNDMVLGNQTGSKVDCTYKKRSLQTQIQLKPDMSISLINANINKITINGINANVTDNKLKYIGVDKVRGNYTNKTETISLAEEEVQSIKDCLAPHIYTLYEHTPHDLKSRYTSEGVINIPFGEVATYSDYIRELNYAKLEIFIPNYIEENSQVSVILRISPSFTMEEWKKALKGELHNTIQTYKQNTPVSARLKSSKAKIDMISPETQLIRPFPSSEWIWELVPNSSERIKMFLQINLADKNQQLLKMIEVNLNIEKNYRKEIIGSLLNQWQWILGTILIPLFVWYITFRKEKQNHNEP